MAAERARSFFETMAKSRRLIEEIRLQRALGGNDDAQLLSAARECIFKSRAVLKKPFVDPLGTNRDDPPS